MGNYSLRNVFTKQPVAIAGTVRSVLYVLVLINVAHLSVEQLAGIALGLELVLGLFAQTSSTSTSAPNLPVGQPVNGGTAVVASVTPPPAPVAGPAGVATEIVAPDEAPPPG